MAKQKKDDLTDDLTDEQKAFMADVRKRHGGFENATYEQCVAVHVSAPAQPVTPKEPTSDGHRSEPPQDV